MEFPIKFDTVKSGWSIVYIEGLIHVVIIIQLRKKTDFHWLRALTWPVYRLSYTLAGVRMPVK